MGLCKPPSGINESNDRSSLDYLHFAAGFAGLIIVAAGVVTLSLGIFVFGALLVSFGMAFFWMEE